MVDKLVQGEKADRSGSETHKLGAHVCVLVWILLSGSVVLFNKFLLSYAGFGYPIALTTIHMGFCSLLCWVLVQAEVLAVPVIPAETYWRAVVPIGALYSLVLGVGNTAYVYLSVSFIQMLKASQTVLVFLIGSAFGTEKFTFMSLMNVLVIGMGVVITTYGEAEFNILGIVLQATATAAEALRVTLIQVMLQSEGVKLGPIATLYYVAPCCFVFLTIPLCLFEVKPLMENSFDYKLLVPLLFLNSIMAFGLNLAVFMLIRQTSALTMSVAGVVKDWMLIGLSVAIFSSTVTHINLVGYVIAFLGVCWYNHSKKKNTSCK